MPENLAQVFSCEFCEILKNTFFHRTPLEDCFWVKLSSKGVLETGYSEETLIALLDESPLPTGSLDFLHNSDFFRPSLNCYNCFHEKKFLRGFNIVIINSIKFLKQMSCIIAKQKWTKMSCNKRYPSLVFQNSLNIKTLIKTKLRLKFKIL